ncbi:hypothetical protein [Endozoicomonas sp. SCSIO W0465]|uniref:hypothetical protein n=1 Tax=Endozoicomonas sp. SCSIO W0465 TaxID=2918516 RepID=UPI002074EF35|nr:hypothetical protein [Endozoicomonas sp. SCSIO W0465]USE38552.1 hypothetical protein MJO57_10485 [Endozoicomonas sp. SCSIO W0465]
MEDILLFLAGLIAGIRLPDLDLLTPGLSHRSAITHSCLPALVIWALGVSPVAAGLALGIAFHLSSDLQPKSWTGGALIKFPVLGSIGMLSPIWLVANVIGCLAIFMEVASGEPVDARQMILALCLLGAGWYFLQVEKRPLLPLITLGFAILLVHAIRGGTLSVKLVWQYFA